MLIFHNKMLFQNTALRIEQIPPQQLQHFYISSSSQSELQSPRQTLQSKFHKPSAPPVRMYKDPEKLLQQQRSLLKTQKQLKEKGKKLEQDNTKKQNLCNEIQHAILRISQVLPQNTVNEDLPETKSYEDAERKVRAEVEAIKKAPDTTKSLMQLAYYEELKEHEERLNRYAKKAKAYNERLHIMKDFNNKQEQEFRKLIPKIKRVTMEKKLIKQQVLKQDKVLCNDVAIKFTKKSISVVQSNTKQLKRQLQQLKFKNEGLEYQLSTIMKNKIQIPQIEKRIIDTKKGINQKQQRIILLKRTFEDKTRTLQYMKKWTEELRQRQDQTRAKEKVVRSDLQTKINMLNKEFQEWNSKYKTLLMEDQSTKINKRRQFNQIEKQSQSNYRRVRLIKHYQVEKLCSKISFNLTLRGLAVQQFTQLIVKEDQILTVEGIAERLKSIDWISSEPDLYKLARYITQDNQHRTQSSSATSFDCKLIQIVLASSVSPVMVHSAYEIHLSSIEALFRRHHDDIRHQISGLNKIEFFDEERLKQGLNFLQIKATADQIRAACIKMFSMGDEIQKYSMLTFRKAFGVLKKQHSVGVEEVDMESEQWQLAHTY